MRSNGKALVVSGAVILAATGWGVWDWNRHRATDPVRASVPILASKRTQSPMPAPASVYDPLAFARANLTTRIGNVETGIPSQCYTKTGPTSNPCWVCHTQGRGDNRLDQTPLQSHYAFTPFGLENHWTNLFVDRRPAMAAIDDTWMLAHLREDNYAPLKLAVQQANADFHGYRPDLDFDKGFDADGFARDGSGWRAFRFKPFPGTFWPTNGSADAGFIRLPVPFQSNAQGIADRATYNANLAILEQAMATPGKVWKAPANAKTPPAADAPSATHAGLPTHFVGGAAAIVVRAWRYPTGTEFLHPLWYVDPDNPSAPAKRMKELRYASKLFDPNEQTLFMRYREEKHEQEINDRPHYSGDAVFGEVNGWGWRYQGYIEDATGRLRLQTHEEQLYCMGCHSGLSVTVDSSFSLPRKLPGAAGWGMQDLRLVGDAPLAGSREPEYQRYMERAHAGDEFRANEEILTRFFPEGRLDLKALKAATTPSVAPLLAPSRERALALAKAYTLVVREQSYTRGRDALPSPPVNVYRQLTNIDTELKSGDQTYPDGQLWLDWAHTPHPETATR